MSERRTITIQEHQLREIVRETVHETLTGLGFNTSEPTQVQADVQYLRKARNGSEEVAKWVRRSAISVGISAGAFVLWEGFKAALRAKGL